MLSRMLHWLERQSADLLKLFSLVLLGLIGMVDYLIGWEISFSIFYLIPVSLAAWLLGRSAGLLASTLAALAWLAADVLAGQQYSSQIIAVWNMLVRFGFFTIVTLMLVALRRRLEHERELSRMDSLTEIVNGRGFYEQAEAQVNYALRFRRPFTIAYVDVDDFKAVNDQHGHRAGDELLIEIARTLKQNLRKVDVVARLGGDEFALLLPETDRAQADLVLQKLREHLDAAMQRGAWPVTFSIGAVTCVDAPSVVDHLLHKADELMYAAKRGGKNDYRLDVLDRHHTSAAAPVAAPAT